jgi:ATP-binding cassette subfamily F protein uup
LRFVTRRPLLTAEDVTVSFGHDPVLDHVTAGVLEGDRIGVVGRNGGGKSTLLRVLAGRLTPNTGRLVSARDLRVGVLDQDPDRVETTIGQHVIGERAEHDWASDPQSREVLTELVGGFDADTLGRSLLTLSGGERRRVDLARLLLLELDVLVLDEPTNHLDVESISWLADHLLNRRELSLLIVTHDRWFLDEVTDRTWEVVRGEVQQYDGGYSAYVLAKAERARQQAAEWARRNNLLRKELAWLRRGPPARTSKPKFRIDAANELIATEPPPRDAADLVAFASARLGKKVIEVSDAQLRVGDRTLLDRLTWTIGPGDRIGIVGVNGAGKTSLVRMLLGELAPTAGRVVHGSTVRGAILSQHLEELDPQLRLLQSVEAVAMRVELGKGRELSASQLCERLGFGPDLQWTPVGDLSGGQRRRLQLTRLLMAGPNVLVLDEPTNDFDVETLAAVEDLLDTFAGTLLIISHDRYFLERVCDRFVALLGDGRLRDLPGGVAEYLRLRHEQVEVASRLADRSTSSAKPSQASAGVKSKLTAAQERAARKEMAKWERTIQRADDEVARLHTEITEHATDYARLSDLQAELAAVQQRKTDAEEAWLAAAEALDG